MPSTPLPLQCGFDGPRRPSPLTRGISPDRVPHLGRYPLVVNLIVGTTCLTKVLMDGGSGLNILYTSTLDRMGIL